MNSLPVEDKADLMAVDGVLEIVVDVAVLLVAAVEVVVAALLLAELEETEMEVVVGAGVEVVVADEPVTLTATAVSDIALTDLPSEKVKH